MGKRIILTDDFDDEIEAAETVNFGLDDVDYEIDLSADNATELRENLSEWIKVARVKRRRGRAKVVAAGTGKARKATPSKSKTAKKSLPGKREQLSVMREWGRKNGWPDLSDKGRVPADVEDAFNAAHTNGRAKELVSA